MYLYFTAIAMIFRFQIYKVIFAKIETISHSYSAQRVLYLEKIKVMFKIPSDMEQYVFKVLEWYGASNSKSSEFCASLNAVKEHSLSIVRFLQHD